MSVSRIHVFKTQQPLNWLVISIHMRNHIPQSSQIYQKKNNRAPPAKAKVFIHHLLLCSKKLLDQFWTISRSTTQRCFKNKKNSKWNNLQTLQKHTKQHQLPTFWPHKLPSSSPKPVGQWNTEPLQSVPTVSTAFSKICLRPSWQNLKTRTEFLQDRLFFRCGGSRDLNRILRFYLYNLLFCS